eukprot:g59894.t1
MSFDTVAPGGQEARYSSMFQREADPEETALSSQGQKRGCGSVASFRGCFAMLAAGVLMYTLLAVHYLWKELNELKAIPGRHDTLATSSDEYLAMLSRCIQYDPSNPNEVSSGCNWKVSRLTAGEARLQSMAVGAELPTNQELGVAASTSTNYAIFNDVFVLGRLGVYTGTCGSNPAAASCTPTFSVRSTNDVTGVVDVGTGLDVTPAGIKAPQVVTSLLDDPTTPGDGGSITVDATLNLGADNLNAAAVTATASVTAPTVTGSTKVVTPLLDDPTTAGDGGSITVDATLNLGADNLNAAAVTATASVTAPTVTGSTKVVTPLLDDPTTAGDGGSITVDATLDLGADNLNAATVTATTKLVTPLLDDPTTAGDGGSITVDATLNLGVDNLNAASVTATTSVTAPTVTGSTKVVTPLLDDPTTAGDGGSITVDATLNLGADNLNAATVTATTKLVTPLLDDPTTAGDGGSITVDATLNLGVDNLNAASVTATTSVTAPTVTGSTKVVTPLLDDPTTAGDGGSITVDATLNLGADNLNAATVTATTKLVTPLLDDPTTAGNGGSITVQATLDLTGNNGLESATFLHLKYPSTAFPNILTIQSTVSSTYLLDVDALADVLSKPVGSMTLTGATVLIQAAKNDPNAVVVEDTNGANVFRIATKDAASGANEIFLGDDLDNSGPPGKFANVFFKGDLVMAQPNMRVVMRTESGTPLVNYCMETGVIGNGPSGLSFATPAQGTCSGLGYDPITSSSTG